MVKYPLLPQGGQSPPGLAQAEAYPTLSEEKAEDDHMSRQAVPGSPVGFRWKTAEFQKNDTFYLDLSLLKVGRNGLIWRTPTETREQTGNEWGSTPRSLVRHPLVPDK